jgi:uncharacterized membrane protein YfcA
MEPIALIAAIFFSEIMGTLAGFGSSTVLLPLAIFLVDFQSAIVIVAITHIAGNIARWYLFKPHLNRSVLLKFGFPSVIAGVVGALLVSYLPANAVRGILGVFLMVYVASSWHTPHLKIEPTMQNCVIGGISSGFIAGLIGTGGALRGAFLHAFGLKKNEYMATVAAIALVVDLTRMPVYIANQLLSPVYYILIPAFVAVAVVGAFLGRGIVHLMPQHAFRKLILAAIFLVGAWFVWEGLG